MPPCYPSWPLVSVCSLIIGATGKLRYCPYFKQVEQWLCVTEAGAMPLQKNWPRTILCTWSQAAWSGLTQSAQQLALNLLWATHGNLVALVHDYLGIEGRGLVQTITGNVKAVLKPIEVVFHAAFTALGTQPEGTMLLRQRWMVV